MGAENEGWAGKGKGREDEMEVEVKKGRRILEEEECCAGKSN